MEPQLPITAHSQSTKGLLGQLPMQPTGSVCVCVVGTMGTGPLESILSDFRVGVGLLGYGDPELVGAL